MLAMPILLIPGTSVLPLSMKIYQHVQRIFWVRQLVVLMQAICLMVVAYFLNTWLAQTTQKMMATKLIHSKLFRILHFVWKEH